MGLQSGSKASGEPGNIALLKQKMDRAGKGLLVTDYVNPELAEVMKNQGIFLSMPQETLSSTPPQSISLSKVVPPLLIYADLMATGDARAIEAAEINYDNYLTRLIREDR
jgi:hypothetical protein